MAADTLTDAERRVLLAVDRYGSTWPLPRTGEYSNAIREVWQRGLITSHPASITPAGREALARHESEANA